MRLRKRAAGLALGAGILFLLGTNVQAGWLFVLCALLLGTLVSGVILPGRMLRGVEIERRAPAEVVQGEEAFVDLIVTNRARGVRLGLTLDDPHVAPTSLYVTKVVTRRTRRVGDRAPGAQAGRAGGNAGHAPVRGAVRRRRTAPDPQRRRQHDRAAARPPAGPAPVPRVGIGSEPPLASRSAPRLRARVPGDPRVPAR